MKSINLPCVVNSLKLNLNGRRSLLKLCLSSVVADRDCSSAGIRAARDYALRRVKMFEGAKPLQHNEKLVEFLAGLHSGKKLRSSTVNKLLAVPVIHDLGDSVLNISYGFSV